MSKIKDFFATITVSTTAFVKVTDGTHGLEDLHNGTTSGLGMFNRHASVVVEFSFDGVTSAGLLDPTIASLRGRMLDNRPAPDGLWLKLQAGSTPATVDVEGWAR